MKAVRFAMGAAILVLVLVLLPVPVPVDADGDDVDEVEDEELLVALNVAVAVAVTEDVRMAVDGSLDVADPVELDVDVLVATSNNPLSSRVRLVETK